MHCSSCSQVYLEEEHSEVVGAVVSLEDAEVQLEGAVEAIQEGMRNSQIVAVTGLEVQTEEISTHKPLNLLQQGTRELGMTVQRMMPARARDFEEKQDRASRH